MKLREEKMEQQRLHQEERVRKALERAKAEPKKQVNFKTSFIHFFSQNRHSLCKLALECICNCSIVRERRHL